MRDIILARIREHGPITFAEFMELALYHPRAGYYATHPQRSGIRGDFYTSVDVGPLFGAMIAEQLVDVWHRFQSLRIPHFDVVDVGAGNGRLMRDILDALASDHADVYRNVRATVVERAAAARDAQPETLGPHLGRVVNSVGEMPASVSGVIVANELLDALPVHLVANTDGVIEEIYVGEHNGSLAEIRGSPSTVTLRAAAERIGLLPGCRAEVGLAADEWVARAAAALDRGFLFLFDYGFDETAFDSASRPNGTLTTYHRHRQNTAWLEDPGQCDLTAHVNLTAVTRAAEAGGLTTVGCVDQTYFLLSLGILDRLSAATGIAGTSGRLAAKTLLMPGGLGSTIKVLSFAKGVGQPRLRGFSSGRLT